MRLSFHTILLTSLTFATVWMGASVNLYGQDESNSEVKSKADEISAEMETQDKTSLPTLDLSFDDIKFDMEPGEEFEKSMLTDEIIDYNKRTIRIRGFIRPSFKQEGLTKFVFVRDNQECCFGPGAALYDCILVELKQGIETEYTLRPITIKGTFFFRSFRGPDGEIWAIYRMNDTVIE
ncbi:MAG: DUF3299 domain-containing protein [Pirellulaceae bacterium]